MFEHTRSTNLPVLLRKGGVAGDVAMKNVKRNHEKLVRKEVLQINSIFRAVRYFEGKMTVRRKRLEHNISCSENKTYEKKEHW